MKTNLLVVVIVGIIVAVIGTSTGIILTQSQDSAFKIGYPREGPNDMFCWTSWIVQHDVPLDHKIIELFLLSEIASLGKNYDIPDRKIEIRQMNTDSAEITVYGNWGQHSTQQKYPNLGTLIAKIDGITEIEEMSLVTCA